MKVLTLWWSDHVEIFIEGGYYAYAYDSQPIDDIECVKDRIVELYCYPNETEFGIPYTRSMSGDNYVFIKEYASYSFEVINDALGFFGFSSKDCEYIHIMCQNRTWIEGTEFIEVISYVFYYQSNANLDFLITEYVFRKSDYSVASMFSGCGGFDLAFHKQGFNVIWANEYDKNACMSYRQNFPNVKLIEKDVRTIFNSHFPKKVDLLIGGYPCQGFSEAGLQCLDDPRNFLYKQFKRGLKAIQPKLFVAENVSGLLSMANGKIIARMVKDFEEENYEVSYKLLDAKDYGVPQDRRRVFIIGKRSDLDMEYSFPKPTHGRNLLPYKTLKDAIWKLKNDKDEYYTGWRPRRFMERQHKRPWNKPSYCIVATPWNVPLHPNGDLMKPIRFDSKGRGDLFKFVGSSNRTLSVKEVKVIQTFPQSFHVSGSLVDQYRQIGNAVPFLLGQELALSIKKSLASEVHGYCTHKIEKIKKFVDYFEFLEKKNKLTRLKLCDRCLGTFFGESFNKKVYIVKKKF